MTGEQRDMRIAEWAEQEGKAVARLLEGCEHPDQCLTCDEGKSPIDLCPSCWARIAEKMKGGSDEDRRTT